MTFEPHLRYPLAPSVCRFLNYEAFMRCLGRYANGSSSWNSGWEDTLALIKGNAQEMAASWSTKGP